MRRLLLKSLALYIDFIVIGTFVTLGDYAFRVAMGYIPGIGNNWYVEIGVSAGLTVLARMLGLSLGEALLDYARGQADSERRGRLWPNLVLGAFLMLDGLKLMVRWSQLDIAVPVFGLVETTALKVVILVAMGIVSVIAGAMLLAFRPMARRAAAGSLALSALSLAVSWPVLDEALARIQVARREAQGLPIRDGEIESIQAMLPIFSGAMLAVCIVLLLLSREQSA